MKAALKLIFIINILFLHALTYAADHKYYVSQDGSGYRNGTSLANAWSVSDFNSSLNWSTIDQANKIDPGDTVYFSGKITSTLYPQGSGSFGNYITLDGYEEGNCDPINSKCTKSAEISNSRSAIYFTNQNYIIIQDFRMSEDGLDFIGKNTSDDSSHIIIRRNEIHDAEGNCINIDYGDYFTIGGVLGDGNEIYDCGLDTSGADISPLHTQDIVISYNHLYATKSNGDSGDHGIDGIVTHYVNRMLVEFNSIHSHNDRYGSDARGEDGMDLKRETADVIIRFNKIYDHQGQANIQIQGGTHNVYVYGNRLMSSIWGGVFIYGRNKGYASIDNIHIWSNEIFGNAKNAITIVTDGDQVGTIYIYNNTMAFNGFAYTDIYGRFHTPDKWDCALKLIAGSSNIKNNIFYKNQPDISTYIQVNTSSTDRIGTLEHNTYYWPGKTSMVGYNGSNQTIATLQVKYNLENHQIAGEDSNPGMNDPDGPDNVYGTADDDYTLNGSQIDNGADLSLCFNIQIQDVTHTVCYNDALDPSTTNWSATPPTVGTSKQENYGSWERGSYVYTGKGKKSSAQLVAPRSLRIAD
jgi:hypothetical protein